MSVSCCFRVSVLCSATLHKYHHHICKRRNVWTKHTEHTHKPVQPSTGTVLLADKKHTIVAKSWTVETKKTGIVFIAHNKAPICRAFLACFAIAYLVNQTNNAHFSRNLLPRGEQMPNVICLQFVSQLMRQQPDLLVLISKTWKDRLLSLDKFMQGTLKRLQPDFLFRTREQGDYSLHDKIKF